MGLPNFLPHVLESSGRMVDLRDYSSNEPNQHQLRIGVDISIWIYKATITFSEMLADENHMSNYGRASLYQQQQQQRAEGGTAASASATETTLEVQEFVAKCCNLVVDRLQAMIKSIAYCQLLVVFDGATPPIKNPTTNERYRKRMLEQEQRDKPVDVSGGSPALERRIKANKRTGAGKHYSKVVEAILVTLRDQKINFMVSLYEADGQLAYLQRMGYINLVVTEDSDFIAYGVLTPILFKLAVNPEGALTRGILLRRFDLHHSKPNGVASKFDFTDFSGPMLACFFCAVGGDYCNSLKGIGVGTALTLVRSAFLPTTRQEGSPLERLLEKLLQATWERHKYTKNDKQKFKDAFLAALLMYRHPVVYDPVEGKAKCMMLEAADPQLISYKPYADLVRNTVRHAAIVGRVVESPLAKHIADGWICPKLLRPRKNVELPEHVKADMDAYLTSHPHRLHEATHEDTAIPTSSSVSVQQARPDLQPQQRQQSSTPDRGHSAQVLQSQETLESHPESSASGKKRNAEADSNVAAPSKRTAGDLDEVIEVQDSSSDEEEEPSTQG